MSKVCGFLLSAVLVVLCLWLSVFSFPNVVRERDLDRGAVVHTEESAVVDCAPEEEVELKSAEIETVENEISASQPELCADDETKSPVAFTKLGEAAELDASEVPLCETTNLSKPSEPSEPQDGRIVPNNNGRTQGGKYVSIPSIVVDAFQTPVGSPHTDRVVRTTRAVVPAID